MAIVELVSDRAHVLTVSTGVSGKLQELGEEVFEHGGWVSTPDHKAEVDVRAVRTQNVRRG